MTADQRVSVLEGRVMEQSNMLEALRADIALLGARMDQRFEAVDERFGTIERRFEAIDRRFDALIGDVDRRFDRLDAKMSRHFMWLAGILVTTLAAVTAAVLAR